MFHNNLDFFVLDAGAASPLLLPRRARTTTGPTSTSGRPHSVLKRSGAELSAAKEWRQAAGMTLRRAALVNADAIVA